MKLDARTKKILKIATVSILALFEIYLIYAANASMTTYHQHPRFVAADGQVAQSSGYRAQFFICLAFAIAVPIGAGILSYLFWFKKSKTAKPGVEAVKPLPTEEPAAELAATAESAQSGISAEYEGASDPSPQPR